MSQLWLPNAKHDIHQLWYLQQVSQQCSTFLYFLLINTWNLRSVWLHSGQEVYQLSQIDCHLH